MPEKLSTRVERVERLIEVLAEKQAKRDDVLVLLTEAQIKTEERFRETDERFRRTDERFRRTDERLSQTDERIDKLVSAIGEMLRTRNGGTH
jgi:predicted translin family RNA/ssDNA-binding protein